MRIFTVVVTKCQRRNSINFYETLLKMALYTLEISTYYFCAAIAIY